jgi:hypothetical protein
MCSDNQKCAASHLSFRLLNPAHAAELAARAEARGGSPNLIAREMVIESLQRSDETSYLLTTLCQKIDELTARQEQLRVLQRTVVQGVRMLLVHGGKLNTAQATELASRLFQDETRPQ